MTCLVHDTLSIPVVVDWESFYLRFFLFNFFSLNPALLLYITIAALIYKSQALSQLTRPEEAAADFHSLRVHFKAEPSEELP